MVLRLEWYKVIFSQLNIVIAQKGFDVNHNNHLGGHETTLSS